MLACLAIALALPFTAQANELKVVTATNFLGTLQQLAGEFEKETGHSITISSGSSGPVYAQIVNGAPPTTCSSRPTRRARKKLDNEGFALPGSRFTYAIGKLVLWSAKPGLVDDQGKVLAGNGWRHIAISNPEIAPPTAWPAPRY
ncbi:molybdate ABC transporter substrate-binding protein [Azotobacter vinelandii]